MPHSTEGRASDSRAPTEGWSRWVLEQGSCRGILTRDKLHPSRVRVGTKSGRFLLIGIDGVR